MLCIKYELAMDHRSYPTWFPTGSPMSRSVEKHRATVLKDPESLLSSHVEVRSAHSPRLQQQIPAWVKDRSMKLHLGRPQSSGLVRGISQDRNQQDPNPI